MNDNVTSLENLEALAVDLRARFEPKQKGQEGKKFILLYGYNGIGKTRLSMAFKEKGKEGGEDKRDTLYFNAFTEDLFNWDNDLESDTKRVLLLNKNSNFFSGIQAQDMENKIRPLTRRYANFNFLIDYKYKDKEGKELWAVNFIREVFEDGKPQNKEYIKVSRGEENIFIWCFFLAVAQLAIDRQESYDWVKYIYIDDPISSLDDNNSIAISHHLAQLLKKEGNTIKTIISSHHTLFFNVMCNELASAEKYFLDKGETMDGYSLRKMYGDTARLYHVAMLKELKDVAHKGKLYTYHFNILRSLLEKTATFHGFTDFSDCIKKDENDEDGTLHKRIVSVLNHGAYSIFEPVEMLDENKNYFRKVLNDFTENYRFNPKIFEQVVTQVVEAAVDKEQPKQLKNRKLNQKRNKRNK
jgi:hypothetical protein